MFDRNARLFVLDRYALPDPAAGNPVGVFTNPILQQLYNDWMVQGNQSSTEALRVGVAIEEVDIHDLQKYLALTNKSDIISAYNILLNGSYCHLRSFDSQLGQWECRRATAVLCLHRVIW